MSKRLQETQGGDDRYGGGASAQASMADQPTQATAAQMARRKIAQTRKASGSQRSSRANTPTANPFGQPQQQSMPSFQPPAQSSAGFGGGFNFTAGAESNPFAQQSQNGTPPPTSFQFGGAPSHQNGDSGLFGNKNSSFGSTFASNDPQPQQNGFNPSTASLFANQNNSTNTPNFGFGQGTQSKQNGATPSTNASFPTFGSQADNPFKSFGQSQQTQSTPSTSFGGFSSQANGAPTQPQTNGTKSLFNTETPKTTTSSIFSSFGQQQNENKTPSNSTAPLQLPVTANAGLLSSQPQGSTSNSLFGSTPPPEQASKPNGSVFLGLDSARAGTVKPGMFTSSTETPKPQASNLFSFGQQKDASPQPQETPKPSPMFSNLNQQPQANGEKTSMFSANAVTEQTPRPASSSITFGQAQQQITSTPGFKFGQSEAQGDDASMTTPGNTPQKPNPFATSSSATLATPAIQGKGLFDRISNGPSPMAQNAAAASTTSLFNTQVPTDTPAQQTQAPVPQGGSLFDRIARDDAPATAIKQTSFTPSTSLFNKAPATAANTPSAAPWLSHAPAAPQTTVTPPTPQRQTTASTTKTQQSKPGSKEAMLRKLNEGLLSHLDKEDPDNNWTPIMEYYLREVAKIEQQTRPGSSATAPAQAHRLNAAEPQPSSLKTPSLATTNTMFASAIPKAPAPATSNIFSAAATQQTPKSNSLFQPQVPATAPMNKKRPVPFEEDDGEDVQKPAPATEKRLKTNEAINYPSLPENASTTARLFQAALDKSTTSSSTPPPTDFVPPSTSGGFKPAAPSTGMPSFGGPPSGGGGFLASFGSKANAEEEKQKKKRKAEDYDSDEETEEQWEKRDRAEQEVKRKKIEDAAKTGSGFDVSRSVTPVPPPGTPAGSGKSLFDRISKEPPATAPSKPSLLSQTPAGGNATTSFFGSKTPAATSSSTLFGGSLKPSTQDAAKAVGEELEKDAEHGTGDNTWKPNTPIKFGGAADSTESTTPAAPPPRFGSLFGESKAAGTPGNSTGTLNIPASKPSLGFTFGGQSTSLSGSRASTPGVTTDGEGASTAGEYDEEAPPKFDPQMEDQSALHPQEREDHTVLFEVAMAKGSKIDEKRDAETGEVSKGWVEKGKGPLYILKHKITGKVSVLMKIKPLGRAAMNFSVQEKMRFDIVGSSGKQVQGAFVDTLADKNAKQMSRWMIVVGKAEVAQEMLSVLNEAAGVA